jgi:hypothetical protein
MCTSATESVPWEFTSDARKSKLGAFTNLNGLVVPQKHEVLVLQPMPVMIVILAQPIVVHLQGNFYAPGSEVVGKLVRHTTFSLHGCGGSRCEIMIVVRVKALKINEP